MDPITAMALFSGGSTLVNTAANLYTNSENNKANRKLAEYGYTKDTEAWNNANNYNLPQNQMARIKAAGLNPQMVYGSGSVTGNTVTQTPKYQAPRMEAPRINLDQTPTIGTYLNAKMNQAQVNNLGEQTKNLSSQTALNTAKTLTENTLQAGEVIKNSRNTFDLNMAKNLQQNSLSVATANLDKLQQEVRNLGQSNQINDFTLKNMDRFGTTQAPTTFGIPWGTGANLLEYLNKKGIELYHKYNH